MIRNAHKNFSRILLVLAALAVFCTFTALSQNDNSEKQKLIQRITQNPEDIEAYVDLSWCYFNEKNYPDAVSTLKIALDMQRNNSEAYYLLGLIYSQNPDNAQLAIDALKNALKFRKQYPAAYAALAQVYLDTRRYYDLIDDFLLYSKNQPANLYFHYYLGEAYYQTNQYKLARKHLKKALPESQFSTACDSLLGLIYYSEKNFEKAFSHFVKISGTPAFNAVREKYQQVQEIQQLLNEGEQALGQKRWSVAVEKYQSILQIDNAFQTAQEKLRQAQFQQYFSRGADFERNRKFKSAHINFRKASQYASPGDESAHQVSEAIGRMKGKMQYTEEVDGIEERADKQLNKSSDDTLRIKEAKENLEAVLKLDPNRVGVNAKIRDAYRQLIDLERNNPKRWNDAIVHLNEAQEYTPESKRDSIKIEIAKLKKKQEIASQIRLAENMAAQKDWIGAFHAFSGIYMFYPSKRTLLNKMIAMGDSLKHQKRQTEALEIYEKIQLLAPDYELAKQREKELKDAIAWPTQVRAFFKSNYGWFILALFLGLLVFVIWWFFPGPIGHLLQFFQMKTVAALLLNRHLKQRPEDVNRKNANYFLKLGQIYQQKEQDKKLSDLVEDCQQRIKLPQNAESHAIWVVTHADLLLFQQEMDKAIENLEKAYKKSENVLIRKKLLQTYEEKLKIEPGNHAIRNRLAEFYIEAGEYSMAQQNLEITKGLQDEKIRKKALQLLQKLEKLQPPTESLFEWTRKFFKEGGFEILDSSEDTAEPYLIVHSSDFERYGKIRVNILENGRVDRDRISELYNRIQQQETDLVDKIAFCVITGPVTADARMQIYTYQLNPRFGVIPISANALRRAVLERNCRNELQTRIQNHTGQTNLYEKKTPVTSPLEFFGRHTIIEDIKTRIDQFDPVGIFGLRKVGKTSLLQYLKEQLPDPVAFLNLEGETGHKACSLLYHKIIKEFVNEIKIKFSAEIDVSHLVCLNPGFDPKNLTGEDFANDLRNLDEILKQHSDRPPKFVLFIDEIEELLPSDKKKQRPYEGYPDFLKVIRGLNQNAKLLIPIVASVDSRFNLGKFSDGTKNPAYTMFVEKKLAGLSREDTDTLVTTIGASLGLEYEPGALERIYTATAGYPLLTRLLCSKFFDPKSSKNKMITIKLSAVKAVIADFPSSYDEDLNQLFTSLKFSQQAVLKVLALHAPLDRNSLQERFLLQIKDKNKNDEFRKALNYLKELGLITGTKNNIQLTIGLLREWLNPGNDMDVSGNLSKDDNK